MRPTLSQSTSYQQWLSWFLTFSVFQCSVQRLCSTHEYKLSILEMSINKVLWLALQKLQQVQHNVVCAATNHYTCADHTCKMKTLKRSDDLQDVPRPQATRQCNPGTLYAAQPLPRTVQSLHRPVWKQKWEKWMLCQDLHNNLHDGAVSLGSSHIRKRGNSGFKMFQSRMLEVQQRQR